MAALILVAPPVLGIYSATGFVLSLTCAAGFGWLRFLTAPLPNSRAHALRRLAGLGLAFQALLVALISILAVAGWLEMGPPGPPLLWGGLGMAVPLLSWYAAFPISGVMLLLAISIFRARADP